MPTILVIKVTEGKSKVINVHDGRCMKLLGVRVTELGPVDFPVVDGVASPKGKPLAVVSVESEELIHLFLIVFNIIL